MAQMCVATFRKTVSRMHSSSMGLSKIRETGFVHLKLAVMLAVMLMMHADNACDDGTDHDDDYGECSFKVGKHGTNVLTLSTNT